MTDPHNLYDAYADRWVMVSVAISFVTQQAWFIVLTSLTNDPTAGWCQWRLNATLNGNTSSGLWADYPSASVDQQSLYVTGNMFDFPGFFQYTKLRVLPKQILYSCSGPLTWFDFWGMHNQDGSLAFTLQAATPIGVSSGTSAYFVNSAGPLSGSSLSVWRITGAPASPVLARLNLPVATYLLPPNADQPGGVPALDTGDLRMLSAAYRSGVIWATHTIAHDWGSGPVAAIHWYAIDPSAGILSQQGTFGADASSYFYPAIMADEGGNAGIVFNRSSKTENVAIRFTHRLATDPSSSLQQSIPLLNSSSAYIGPGLGSNRWGDYSSLAADPSGGSVWAGAEFATSLTSWGTWIQQIGMSAPAGPLVQTLPSPVRLADTRSTGGPIQSGASRCFGVTGVGGIPADAGAVLLNVTAVGQTTNGWLTVYPNGQAVPVTSTLNFGKSEYAMANGAIMRVGTGGQVCVNVGTIDSAPGSSQVILDATGFLPNSALSEVSMLPAPVRLSDTRSSGGPIGTGTSRCFQVAGVQGIPSGVAAVILNATAVSYGTKGWLTVYPNAQPVPATSTVNFDPSEYAMANNVIMPIGAGNQVCVNVGTIDSAPGSSQVILDAVGFLTTSGLARMPMLTSPQRLVDTRTNGGPIGTGTSRCFTVTGQVGIPTNATGLVMNLTAVGYGTQGWLTAYPGGQALPATSTLNFDTSEYAMANGAIVGIGSGGQVCVNVGTIDSRPGTPIYKTGRETTSRMTSPAGWSSRPS